MREPSPVAAVIVAPANAGPGSSLDHVDPSGDDHAALAPLTVPIPMKPADAGKTWSIKPAASDGESIASCQARPSFEVHDTARGPSCPTATSPGPPAVKDRTSAEVESPDVVARVQVCPSVEVQTTTAAPALPVATSPPEIAATPAIVAPLKAGLGARIVQALPSLVVATLASSTGTVGPGEKSVPTATKPSGLGAIAE
jgi:hypothetical protein